MSKIMDKIKAGAKIIDVRSPDEYADGFYKGAINIPVSIMPKKMDLIGSKDTPIIVYCASGSRSAVAMSLLKAAGFTEVTNAGGLGDMPA